MRYLIVALFVAVAVTSIVGESASAAVASHIVMSEIQTATTVSATQEFIELYNPTDGDIAVAGWTLEYKSATGAETSWTKKATLSGTIKAHGFYLIAPKSYLSDADGDFTATLAGTAGNIRLKDAGAQVIDQVGYGDTVNAAEGGTPAEAPPAGESIERLPGRLSELGGNASDTNNNGADFILRTLPQPQTTASLIEFPLTTEVNVEDDTTSVTPPASESQDSAPVAVSYAPIDITELLPNPMSPLTDAKDEFIELYNPTDQAVNLKGYTLRTGSSFHSFYVLPDLTIASGVYLSLYSTQTKLSMPNSGGAVRLLDPNGVIVSETPAYGAAPDGESWARIEDGWQWTLQTTPGKANILAAPAVTTKAAAVAKSTKPKSTKAPSKAAAKPKKAAAKKPAAKKKSAVAKIKTASAALNPLAQVRHLQPATWLIIGLVVLTISYALYEFRYDLQHLYYRLRGNPKPRGRTKPSSQGGRRD